MTRSAPIRGVRRLGTLLIGAALLAGCQGQRFEEPPIHLIPNMDYQQKFEAQERNDFFSDGRAMRPPVEGTVARGHLKDNAHLHRGRGLDGRLVDSVPNGMKVNAALLERGQERYDIYCAPCHDRAGTGHGPATRRGGGFQVQPPTYHQARLQAMPLGYLYDVATNGKGTMLGYAAQIPVEDRWAIAVWVRTLQVHGKAKKWNETTDLTAVAAADSGKSGTKEADKKSGQSGKPAKAGSGEGDKSNG